MSDIFNEADRWLQLCASCDCGLPVICTCPEGDYRPAMLMLYREVERLRAENSKLSAELVRMKMPTDVQS